MEVIQQLLADAVIEESSSPYPSPAFLVPKSPDNFRAVIDNRVRNHSIKVESTPLSGVLSTFSWFKKARYFFTLDLNQAYQQFPLAVSSEHLKAFAMGWNLYQ